MLAETSNEADSWVAAQMAEVAVLPVSRWHHDLPNLTFSVEVERGERIQHRAEESHPFAGSGKLLLALTIADLGAKTPTLLTENLPVSLSHRRGARTGSLRLLSGDLSLSVDDALNLVLSSGDGASALALLEFFERESVDLAETAREIVNRVGLDSTTVLGTEDSDESWGEGLVGTTTPKDLSSLLARLYAAVDKSNSADSPRVNAETSLRVLGWMRSVFEPGGLASALPGYGPHRTQHWTTSGWESVPAGKMEGCTSVLITHSINAGWVCIAAHHPAWKKTPGVNSARDVSAVFGSLGLSAYLNENA